MSAFRKFSRVGAILVLMAANGAIQAAGRKPNVILILADDLGYECVTANGGESYDTPHLDRLAATGMRFEQCHVQPTCTPTRVELMTGIHNVRNYGGWAQIDPGVTTFAHLLERAGYATGIAGKWQLGSEPQLPQRLGFHEAYLHNHTREKPARPPRYANPGLEHNGKPLDFNQGEYGPTLVNDFALDFVTRHRARPFLLYYSMILAHEPFQPTPDSPDWNPATKGEGLQKDGRNFAAMVSYLDKMVGRLVAKLDELNLRQQTLLVFLGDNGTHRTITSRFKGRPYPGGKFTITARGTHVPLIANWPGRVPTGRVNRDLIAAVDFLPTLCEATGSPMPPSPSFDGRSFLPQLLGRSGEPREWLYCWYERLGGPTAEFEFAMTTRHKLYRDGRFFDLTKDPFEERALAVARLDGPAAAAARELQAALDRYRDARPARFRQPGEAQSPSR